MGGGPFVELPGGKVQTAFCDGSHHERGDSHASRRIPAPEQTHPYAGDGEHGGSFIVSLS